MLQCCNAESKRKGNTHFWQTGHPICMCAWYLRLASLVDILFNASNFRVHNTHPASQQTPNTAETNFKRASERASKTRGPPPQPPPQRGTTEKQLKRRETTRRPVAALATIEASPSALQPLRNLTAPELPWNPFGASAPTRQTNYWAGIRCPAKSAFSGLTGNPTTKH